MFRGAEGYPLLEEQTKDLRAELADLQKNGILVACLLLSIVALIRWHRGLAWWHSSQSCRLDISRHEVRSPVAWTEGSKLWVLFGAERLHFKFSFFLCVM